MKKFIYIALIALATSLTISSCTEEDVAPTTERDNGSTTVNSDGKN